MLPQVTIVSRHHADELLVMASDGLWDVMNNQEACTLAKKCLLRARQRGSSRQVRLGPQGRACGTFGRLPFLWRQWPIQWSTKTTSLSTRRRALPAWLPRC